MPVQALYSQRSRSRNAFKVLKAGQHRYQLQIKPWSLEEEQFRFAACFPLVKAVCLHCSKAVPPGLCNSDAYKWMICHLNGYGLHAYTPFPEKCNALSYSQRGRFHSRHLRLDYWMLKMWLGEPDFDNPGFMPA